MEAVIVSLVVALIVVVITLNIWFDHTDIENKAKNLDNKLKGNDNKKRS